MECINWKVVTGCHLISDGCDSCPSFTEYRDNGMDYSPVTHVDALDIPLLNRKPSVYNVAFGADLFQSEISAEFIRAVFHVMNNALQHTFILITKRIERALDASPRLDWSTNIGLGVSVESQAFTWRIGCLQSIPAKYRFISMVPLLGDVQLPSLEGINEVGAVLETWGLKRTGLREWIDDIQAQCVSKNINFSEELYLYENQEVA